MTSETPTTDEMSGPCPTLTGLPPELIISNLLPHLPPHAIQSLSQTSRYFHSLANDETFWRGKIREDYKLNVGVEGMMRVLPVGRVPVGWGKRLWRGLRNPRVYVWGNSENSRLALPPTSPHLTTPSYRRCVPYPVEITSRLISPSLSHSTLPLSTSSSHASTPTPSAAGIIQLSAGGYSFAARTSSGHIYVWGQLDANHFAPAGGGGGGAGPGWGMGAVGSGGWEFEGKRVGVPRRLGLAASVVEISMGRTHLLALDSDNLVWELRQYGRAFYHTSPHLSSPTPTSRLTQLSAGWDLSSCLSSSGQIYTWRPFSRLYRESLQSEEELGGPLFPDEGQEREGGTGGAGEEFIPVKWGKVGPDAVQALPPIPTLPPKSVFHPSATTSPSPSNADEQSTQSQGDEAEQILWDEDDTALPADDKGNKVIMIGAGEGFVLALRRRGEVWICEVDERDGGAGEDGWRYIPQLSGPDIISVTVSFRNVISYSSECVRSVIIPHQRSPHSINSLPVTRVAHPFAGSTTTDNDQPVSFGKIALGDYHKVAMDTLGGCYTWGENSGGQLGRAPVNVTDQDPKRVIFGKGDEDVTVGRESRSSDGDFVGEDAERGRRFVFDVTAGGWHSGVLVVDMGAAASPTNPNSQANLPSTQQEPPAPTRDESQEGSQREREELPGPFFRGIPGIRLGFAARGATRGTPGGTTRGMERNWRRG